MAGNNRKVKVNEGWAVAVDGKQHSGGQTVNVDRDTANTWIANGWATQVKPAKPAAKTTTAKPAAKTTRPNTGRQHRP